jgi:hypothetical protein
MKPINKTYAYYFISEKSAPAVKNTPRAEYQEKRGL